MSKRPSLIPLLVIVAAAVATVVIGWTSARRLDTLWDEPIDRDIAVGLCDHPLTGDRPAIDASQMRLPMYVNAVVFAVTGRDDLAMSRGVSLCFAAVTVVLTGLLGRRLFGSTAGVLAAVLLALSPYFLAFGRVSMTEGDVFFACFTVAATLGFVRYVERPTAARWVAVAVLLALALGAKLFGGVLFVAFGIMAWLARPPRDVHLGTRAGDVRRLHRLLAAACVLVVIVGGLAAMSRQAAVTGRDAMAARYEQGAIIGWVVLVGLWACGIVFAVRRRVLAPGRAARFGGMVVLAGITFFAVMPVHLLEHEILRDIARRTFRWDDPVAGASWVDHLRLYSGILLIKLTVPLGVLSAAALCFAAARSRRDPRWRACFVPVVAYLLLLCLLPLRQTFYLMGVYPLLLVLTAGFAVQIGRWLRDISRRARTFWAVCVVGLTLHLGVNVYRAYPHFHIYGYDLIGDRWLGEESRGYRNLIQTPSDGVESLILWCNTHVPPGARVVSYLWEDQPGHIVDRVLAAEPRYRLIRRGLTLASSEIPPPPSLSDADFVLVHINNRLGYGGRPPDWPPADILDAEFNEEHRVSRGALDVAWVYRRR